MFLDNRVRPRPSAVLSTAAAIALIGAVPAVADGADREASYYSTKQAYEPQGDSYSSAPDGFSPIHTQSVDRHGSRGLSGFKYDDLAQQMLEEAQDQDALTDLGEDLIPQVEAMMTANEDLEGGFDQEAGYGNLTNVGREELHGIGERNRDRNAELMESVDDEDLKIAFTSSGEDRATDSAWNFGSGFLDTNSGLQDNVDYDEDAGHVTVEPRADLLYAHKDEDSPGYERYQEWADGQTLEEKVDAAYDEPDSRTASRDLLEHIFAPEFIDKIDDGDLDFTARGEDEDEAVEGIVDAALQFYNLYIIAPAMAEEPATPSDGWIFDRYMDEENGPVLEYLLDVEDYYEKGPGIEGETVSFDNYEPLLDEMLDSVERRAEGGDVAADYRFAHAEALIPLAALLKTPGSEQGVPEDEVMNYGNSDWRGSDVSPMGGNIQWDSFENESGRVIVRMLYNEKEIPFNEGCVPIEDDSLFYTLDELKQCLPLGSTSDHSEARLPGTSVAAGSVSSAGSAGSVGSVSLR